MTVRWMAVGHMGGPVGMWRVCDDGEMGIAVFVFMDGDRVHDTAWANAEK